MSVVDKLFRRLSKSLVYLGGFLLACIGLLTVVQVVLRYGFNQPIYGYTESVTLTQVVIVSLSGAYTILRRGHVVIGLVVDRLSARRRAYADVVAYSVALFFVGLAAERTFVYAASVAKSGVTTNMLAIPLAPFYYVVAVGWVLLALGTALVIVDSARKAVQK